jgi:hypothetical protein
VALEYAVEITYPLPEGTSAGLLSFMAMVREGTEMEGREGESRKGGGGEDGCFFLFCFVFV